MNESTTIIFFVIQLGLLFLVTKFCGYIGKKSGAPQYICEILAGIVIGPYALGGLALPGLPNGIFRLSNEWYILALIAAAVFFFVSGLGLNMRLFFRYSLAGSIIGFTGAVFSFVFGDLVASILLKSSFFSPQCLFLGILSLASSSCLSARILAKNKKMNSPEGVAVLMSSGFDNVPGIVIFALVSAIIMMSTGSSTGAGTLNVFIVAGKTFGIILGATILGLILSGAVFAAFIHQRLQKIYELFTPLLFAFIGMMVNLQEIISSPVLILGAVYSLAVVLAKFIGSSGPALLLGFNWRGSLRIGAGLIPRGESALVIAGIGLALGIFSQQVLGATILMVLISSLIAAPLLKFSLKLPGPGTKRSTKGDDQVCEMWKFTFPEIDGLVLNMFFLNLVKKDFYIQMIDRHNNFLQARKNDIALSVKEEKKSFIVETSTTDMPFVKNSISEIINNLHESVKKLPEPSDIQISENETGTGSGIFSQISTDCISVNLKANTKNEILTELVDILSDRRRLQNRDLALHDILEREKIMSTGMQYGIALPHAKSEGVSGLAIAIGIKKEGIDFGSIDGQKTRLFILMVSPKKTSGPHVQFLASMSAVLKNQSLREAIINAETAEEVYKLLNTIN